MFVRLQRKVWLQCLNTTGLLCWQTCFQCLRLGWAVSQFWMQYSIKRVNRSSLNWKKNIAQCVSVCLCSLLFSEEKNLSDWIKMWLQQFLNCSPISHLGPLSRPKIAETSLCVFRTCLSTDMAWCVFFSSPSCQIDLSNRCLTSCLPFCLTMCWKSLPATASNCLVEDGLEAVDVLTATLFLLLLLLLLLTSAHQGCLRQLSWQVWPAWLFRLDFEPIPIWMERLPLSGSTLWDPLACTHRPCEMSRRLWKSLAWLIWRRLNKN